MKAKIPLQENTMTIKGTTQLSMQVDPELKKKVRMAALNNGETMTDWVVRWIEHGLNEEKQSE